MNELKRLFQPFFPFILIGMSIALVISLFVLFSYILLWGIVIGATLWGISILKKVFFPKPIKPSKGRVIEHDPR